MTTMTLPGSDDEVAELRKQVEKLTALVEANPTMKTRRRLVRRPLALVATAVLGVGAIAGVAGATGSTTEVSFVALSPARTVLSNASIAANKTNSPVVIGSTTTVPSNATAVQLTVTAKGASSGTLAFYPALNPSGGSGQSLHYPGSNLVATTTIQENVGQAGELTFFNNGAGSATVTAKITGYSTQVTAGDINGVGGTSGQLLTNDGAGGAVWQDQAPPPVPSASNFASAGGTSGQVLTSSGTGVSWADARISGYQVVFSANVSIPAGGQAGAAATCPAGKVAISGGAYGGASVTGEDINTSRPSGPGNWQVFMDNGTANPQNFSVYAVCVNG